MDAESHRKKSGVNIGVGGCELKISWSWFELSMNSDSRCNSLGKVLGPELEDEAKSVY